MTHPPTPQPLDLEALRRRVKDFEDGCNCYGGFTLGCPSCDSFSAAPYDRGDLLSEIARHSALLSAAEEKGNRLSYAIEDHIWGLGHLMEALQEQEQLQIKNSIKKLGQALQHAPPPAP